MVTLLLRRQLDNMQNSTIDSGDTIGSYEVLMVLFFGDSKILVNDMSSYHHGFSEFNLVVSNIVSCISLHLN